MRRLACLSLISLLAMPAIALAQDASAPPTPDQSGMQQPPPPDQPGMQPPPDQLGMQAPPEPGMAPPPGAPPGPPPYAMGPRGHDGGMMQKWQQRFDAANTTHDGHLTLAQAQAAGMKPIVDHFAVIDTRNRGYLTFNEIMAWHLDQEAQKLERRAAALRAQD